jgi:prevent-host-death family protein
MRRTWTEKDAKSKFGKLVENAMNSRPQFITRDGKLKAVVVSVGTWEEMNSEPKKTKKSKRPLK